MIFSIRLAARYLLRFLICASMLAPAISAAQVPPAATLPAQAATAAELAHAAARARHLPLALFAPTAWPDAISAGQATDIKFTILLAGGAAGPQPAVTLNISGVGASVPMRDDGLGADLSAGDRIYSASFQFSAADAAAGRCYDARVSALSVNGQTVLSGARRVCVTQFAVGIAGSNFDAGNVVVFGQGREAVPVVADEALIGVSSNLGDDRIAAIAALVDGTVVGSARSQNVYQIRLGTTQTLEGLQQALARLQKAGGVLFAVPNAIGGLQTPPVLPLTTSDPLLPTQANLDRINATRAWRITTGNAVQVIAVVDTGADFDHPDFWATPLGTTTRFATSGSDLVAADCAGAGCVAVAKPTTCHATNVCNAANAAVDTYGHGTVVAGFASAALDNALGIAGVTGQGQLLAVRFAANEATASSAKLLDGINYARGQGARIISISYANPAAFVGTLVCPAVAGAESEGRLVVAAAGNDGSTGNNYPGACASAMPVANSEVSASLDVIHTGTLASNFGAWVSLAGPGTSVQTTARTAAACPTCNAAYVSGTGNAAVTGTSFSAPLAAGAAGLVLARSPSTTNAALRTLLFSTGVALQAPAAHIRRIDVLAAILTFNTDPTALNLSGLCIPENTDSTAGASVGTLTTVDADAGSTGFEYSIVGGVDAARFSIGGVNGDQLVITDGILNFETKASYAVTVRTTDVGDGHFDQGLVVSVCNINEPPVVTGGTFSIPENSAAGTTPTPGGTVVATDPEAGPLAFAITAGNTGGAFAINGAGVITVANSLALDYETVPGHAFTLTVNVSDGMNTVPVIVTINLDDVFEAPAFTIFNDRTVFLAALGGAPAQTQDFTGFASEAPMQGVEFMPGVSATHNRPGLRIFDSPSVGKILFRTSGDTDTSVYDITISQTYHAFGFDIAAFNPAALAGTMQVFFQDGTNTIVSVANTSGSEIPPVFFGVISSSPVNRVTWSEPLEVGGAPCCEETGLDNFVANP